jgi:hypothetical protein
MLLCEVALGNVKELGTHRDEEEDNDEVDNDDDQTKPLDLKKFQSRKGLGRQAPDPKHTIIRNDGLFVFK